MAAGSASAGPMPTVAKAGEPVLGPGTPAAGGQETVLGRVSSPSGPPDPEPPSVAEPPVVTELPDCFKHLMGAHFNSAAAK